MVSISFIPDWFLNYGIIFQFAFAIITLLVSIYSFRVYRLSGQKKSRTFGLAFLFISISYFIQSFINLAIISELNENVLNLIEFRNLITLDNIAIFFHMIFFVFGLVTLIYMILGGKNRLLYVISLIVSALFIFASANNLSFFYIFSSLLLIFILSDYVSNYIKNRNGKTFLIMLAFVFLLVGHLNFIFLATNQLVYVVVNFLEFAAYILILINLLRVIKK
jgi:hypothetical protein